MYNNENCYLITEPSVGICYHILSKGELPLSLVILMRSVGFKSILGKILPPLFLVGVALLFFLPVIDTDLGWHLQYGEYFLQHGKFLKENIHATLLAGYYWPNSYILYQPLLALVYRGGGLVGLSILGALVLTATFGVVYSYLGRDLLKTIAVAALVSVGGGSVLGLGLRAQIFSLLGCAVLLYVLERRADSWPKAGLIFLTLMLWANFHGAFAVGVIIVGLWALSKVIFSGFSNWKMPLAYMVAALVGPLLNPYGVGLYSYVISHLQVPLRNLIAEWVPPVPTDRLASLGLFGVSVYLISVTQNFRRNLFRLAVGSALLFLALSARRNLPLFFLVQGIVLVELFSEVKWPWRRLEVGRWGIVLLVAVGGLIYGFAVRLPETVEASRDRDWCRKSRLTRYPCDALEFVKEQGITGPVFNNYEWGGFLIWHYPESKVFVDGRMPAWSTPTGKSPYTIFLEVLQARPGYQETLDRHEIEWLLFLPNTFLDLELRGKEGSVWEEVYRDEVAVVYLRL